MEYWMQYSWLYIYRYTYSEYNIYIIIYGEFLGPVQIEWIFVFFFCQQYSNVGFYLWIIDLHNLLIDF